MGKSIFTGLLYGILFIWGGQTNAQSSSSPKATSSMKILYVYDALCGWCYGFSPVMKQLMEEHGHQIQLEVISGGLRIDDRVGTINEVAPYIKTAYRDVEKAAGVKFGEGFIKGPLASGNVRMNSLPPARALAIFRQKFPEQSLTFAARLHEGIYGEGIATEDLHHYARFAAELGYTDTNFSLLMEDPVSEQWARKDFERAAMLGVRGYPAVLKEENGRWVMVVNGFVPYPRLLQLLGLH
jgi:putative protein-disulfide isomerase